MPKLREGLDWLEVTTERFCSKIAFLQNNCFSKVDVLKKSCFGPVVKSTGQNS